jgi:hypothetical protein
MPDSDMLTRKEFCEKANISLTTFHELKRNGHGPEETHYPGTSITRISIEAYHAWHQRMDEWSKSDEAKLEQARRSENAKIAGEKAALSATHVSKRGRADTKKPVKLAKRSQKG